MAKRKNKFGLRHPGKEAKVERCVKKVKKTGKSKVSAIRICKSSVDRPKRKTRA